MGRSYLTIHLGYQWRIYPIHILTIGFIAYALFRRMDLETCLVVFSGIALHELGHALAASFVGIGVESIELVAGGLTRLKRVPLSPKEGILVSGGGALMNALLAIVCYPFSSIGKDISYVHSLFCLLSLAPLAGFDGGLILYYSWIHFFGPKQRLQVKQVLCWWNTIVGCMLITVGVWALAHNFYSIGLAIIIAAEEVLRIRRQQRRALELENILESAVPHQVIKKDVPVLSEQAPIRELFYRCDSSMSELLCLVLENHRVSGYVKRSVLKRIKGQNSEQHISEIAERTLCVCTRFERLSLLAECFGKDKEWVVLIDPQGELVGIVVWSDVEQYLHKEVTKRLGQEKGKLPSRELILSKSSEINTYYR